MKLRCVALWLNDGAVYATRGGVVSVIVVSKFHFTKFTQLCNSMERVSVLITLECEF